MAIAEAVAGVDVVLREDPARRRTTRLLIAWLPVAAAAGVAAASAFGSHWNYSFARRVVLGEITIVLAALSLTILAARVRARLPA